MAPSLLAADFGRLADELGAIETGGADLVHLDVMDGQFVDNITLGPVVIRGIRKLTSLFLDTHLMVQEPQRYVDAFRAAGCDGITVHVEATRDVHGALAAVRGSGAQVGLALNPDTPLAACVPYLDAIDLLLVMSVHPGHGGQKFRVDVLSKVEEAAERRRDLGLTFAIEIDGGIDARTAAPARRAGADVLVAGTAVFRHPPYAERIAALRAAGRPASP